MTNQTKPAEKLPGRWGLREPQFFFDCEGERVIIHLMSGETLTGFITGLDMYGIGFEPENPTRALWVMKHAIAYIERIER